MKHVIAFTGYRTIGKTTTVNNISNYLTYCKISNIKLSFADLLRNWIEEKYGSEIALDTKSNKNMTVKKLKITTNTNLQFAITNRDLMIKTGEYLRSLDVNIFANAVCNKIKQIDLSFSKKENKVYLIDDLRFENELNQLKALERYINPYDLSDKIKVHIVYLNTPRAENVLQEDKEANDFINPALCDYVFCLPSTQELKQYNKEIIQFLNMEGINIG